MSMVSNLFSLQLNTGRSSNAEFGIMKTSNNITNRAMKAGSLSFGSNNLKTIHEQEKNDMAKLHTMNLMRTISQAMAESAEKKLDYYA